LNTGSRNDGAGKNAAQPAQSCRKFQKEEATDADASSDEYDEADSLCNERSQDAIDSQKGSKNFSLQAVLNNHQCRQSEGGAHHHDHEKVLVSKEKSTTNSDLSSDYQGKTLISSVDYQRKGRQEKIILGLAGAILYGVAQGFMDVGEKVALEKENL
jgi:hypothetical protein